MGLLCSPCRSIGNLHVLEVLDVRFNKLEILPEEIENLSSLKELDLFGNKLQRVPYSLARLPSLRVIFLRDNPIVDPPLEIVSQGSEFILAYLMQRGIDF